MEQLAPGGVAALHASPLVSPAATGVVVATLVALLRHLYIASRSWGDGGVARLPRITDSGDVAALAAVVVLLTYLFAVAGLPLAFNSGGNGNGPLAAPSPSTSPTSAGGKKTVHALSH